MSDRDFSDIMLFFVLAGDARPGIAKFPSDPVSPDGRIAALDGPLDLHLQSRDIADGVEPQPRRGDVVRCVVGEHVAFRNQLRPWLDTGRHTGALAVNLCKIPGEDPKSLDRPPHEPVSVVAFPAELDELCEGPQHLAKLLEWWATQRGVASTCAAAASSVITLTQAPTSPDAAVANTLTVR